MIYEYSKIIKNNTYNDGINLFNIIPYFYNVELVFSANEFRNFLNNLYNIYEYHNEIYKYRDDVKKYLIHAINSKQKSDNKKLVIEDILDSIWEVKTSEDNDTIDKSLDKVLNIRRIKYD